MPIPEYLSQTYRSRIAFWDDERAIGNSLIIILRDGWQFPLTECHTIGVDTVKEALAAIRSTAPCSCSKCKEAEVKKTPEPFTGFCPDCGWKLDCLENTTNSAGKVRKKRYKCMVCGLSATIGGDRVLYESAKTGKGYSHA